MMNLLPQAARKELLKEYWVRVLSVWSVICTFAALAVVAALLPSYVLMESKQSALASERAALAGKDASITSVEAEVLYTNALASSLEQKEDLVDFFPIVTAIRDTVPEGVVLQSYRLQRTADVVETVEVQGVAVSRDSLIAFQEQLRGHQYVKDAVVPIEDFIAERDLLFTVTIMINEEIQ